MFEAVHIFDRLTWEFSERFYIHLKVKFVIYAPLAASSWIPKRVPVKVCSVYSVSFSCVNVIMGCICPMQSIFCQMKMISLII